MKGLEDLKNNENLKRKVEEARSPKDACDMLEKEGYKVSEDELTEFYLDDVSGGLFDSNKTEVRQGIGDSTVVGDRNFVWIGQGQGNTTMSSIDPMELLKVLLGNG